MNWQRWLVGSLAAVWPVMGQGGGGVDIPAAAPQDAVMAAPAEVRQMRDWASRAFTGAYPPDGAPGIRVEVRRQDHSALRFGESCLGTPLRLGDRQYERGLGTHANSELLLRLPPGARAFHAVVGIDNNPDTGGARGSVEFSVEVGGAELFRSPTCRGGDAPLPVDVELPAETRELVLKVDGTGDGLGHDQADWADAQVVTAGAQIFWADEYPLPFISGEPPFSFTLDAVSSRDLLPGWSRTTETTARPGRVIHSVRWRDEATGLCAAATVTAFTRYPAVEWVLSFENAGAAESPLLAEVHALDAVLRTGYFRQPVVLHQIAGDVCGEQSFVPVRTTLELNKPMTFAPAGGRPSNQTFPFFNAHYAGEGMITAIGWSGQWSARLERSDRGPTRVQVGMEGTRLRLRPGESIRGPRILVMPWRGDPVTAQNRFRRLLLFEYAPKRDGRPTPLPAALQCFDRYSWSVPEWSTEAGQLRAVAAARRLGLDTHWFDAAWFEGGFPNGVGNWFCRADALPRGLAPIGKACRESGLKFLVWFEPERVAPGSQIAREHPEFVFGGAGGGLFNLGDAAARRWLADLLSARIAESGIDCYRNDFNIDPLPFWRRADSEERQGMTEIRYVEGHYALWDELLARHPGLFIDNCASGGRRIDLETVMRAVPLWRSDTGCGPGHAEWDQTQILGLSPYLPLFAGCAWEPRAYVMRSTATAGFSAQFDYLDSAFDFDAARAAVAEASANRAYWYGDFYPLTPARAGGDVWAAWQLHRADLDAGIVLAFRRADCPYPALQVSLRALPPDGRYAVDFVDEEYAVTSRRLTGAELASGFELRLPRPATSMLVRYVPDEPLPEGAAFAQ